MSMSKSAISITCLMIAAVGVCWSAGNESRDREKQALFNGKDFTGWKLFVPDPKVDVRTVWSVRNGVIRCEGKPAGYMRTDQDYQDYRLRVEWRWPDGRGGNSGVLVHMGGKDGVWPKSLECQLANQNAGDLWVIGGVEFKEHADKNSKRVNGRRTIKNAPSNEKPLGEWNSMEIVCKADTVTVYVNGLLQNTATACKDADGMPLTKGKICLQSEGTPIEFRSVTIEPLARIEAAPARQAVR